MTNSSFERQARRAGAIVKKTCRATVYTDPVTGLSISDGNRSSHSFHHERRRTSFLRRLEMGGLT